MKHLKLYEEFDLDRFLDNPEKELADDNSPEINVGNYVDSYRGKGQVLDIDSDFAKVELHNSKGNIVKVPVFALTKISHEDLTSAKVGDSQAELAELVSTMITLTQLKIMITKMKRMEFTQQVR
jgi:hypothetical protein